MATKDNETVGLPVKKIIEISEPWMLKVSTSREDTANHTKGEGERIQAIIDRDGNRYDEWDDRLDKIIGLPRGITVWREVNDGDCTFSMSSFARIEPPVCPVLIEINQENYETYGGVALRNEYNHYQIRVERKL